MIIDYNRAEPDIKKLRYFLGFRETIVMSLGLFPPTMTRASFYDLYRRLHQRLTKLGVIEFPLPEKQVFVAMLAKLRRKDIVREVYSESDQKYCLKLTAQGQASFDVISSNLRSHPEAGRILNVFEFYKNLVES